MSVTSTCRSTTTSLSVRAPSGFRFGIHSTRWECHWLASRPRRCFTQSDTRCSHCRWKRSPRSNLYLAAHLVLASFGAAWLARRIQSSSLGVRDRRCGVSAFRERLRAVLQPTVSGRSGLVAVCPRCESAPRSFPTTPDCVGQLLTRDDGSRRRSADSVARDHGDRRRRTGARNTNDLRGFGRPGGTPLRGPKSMFVVAVSAALLALALSQPASGRFARLEPKTVIALRRPTSAARPSTFHCLLGI